MMAPLSPMLKTAKPSWAQARVREDQVFKYLEDDRDFIPDEEIEGLIRGAAAPDAARVREILQKSLAIENLSPEETAALMRVEDPALLDEMQAAALAVKKKVYDNRIVTFAPLYLGNYCVNDCAYCGLRRSNYEIERKVLNFEQVRREVEVLAGEIGHRRLIVVYGEHPYNDVDYIIDSIREVYSVQVPVRNGIGNVRRVNVNAPPFSIEDLRRIHGAGIGTYQVFQETYHRGTYAKLHPAGTLKSNFRWRLYSLHRALEAGIEDVGIGALLGLHDWRFEVLGLVYHARELEQRMGIGPHTVSFPRLEPALNLDMNAYRATLVSDAEFLRILTIVRLAIPYAGMIVTSRETPGIRRKAIDRGITQIDASCNVEVGGYQRTDNVQELEKQQFMLGDTRTLDQVVRDLAERGHITSFCTAGYRCGRTGKSIMELLRTGVEGKFCKLNAILTYKEWLDDFAGEETRRAAQPVLEREIEEVRVNHPKAYPTFKKYYDRICAGERDLYL